MADWRVRLLKVIGAKPTKANLRFLDTWQRWEGGHTKNNARFNWLNTTKNAPGATGSINSVGVKAFDSFEHGIQATAATLANGRYDDIVAALRAGNPFQANPSAGLQTWVSGRPDGNPGYAQKILGGKAGSKSLPSPGAPSQAAGGNLVKPSSLTGPSWDWTMDFVFGKSDPEFAEMMKQLNASMQESVPDDPQSPAQDDLKGSRPSNLKPGKGIVTSQGWKETAHAGGHTGGLPDFTEPADIMGAPGTAVYAPASGVVTQIGSAQEGGRSIWLKGDDGYTYWLGHIDPRIKVGSRIKVDQLIATVSGEHPRPHLHIDRRRDK